MEKQSEPLKMYVEFSSEERSKVTSFLHLLYSKFTLEEDTLNKKRLIDLIMFIHFELNLRAPALILHSAFDCFMVVGEEETAIIVAKKAIDAYMTEVKLIIEIEEDEKIPKENKMTVEHAVFLILKKVSLVSNLVGVLYNNKRIEEARSYFYMLSQFIPCVQTKYLNDDDKSVFELIVQNHKNIETFIHDEKFNEEFSLKKVKI